MFDFVKMHGCGNDFVMIDGMKTHIDFTEEEVKLICDRHFGIGADGIIVVRQSSNPSCAGYMHYINSDGTLAQMCGNGVRCTAKFLIDNGYVSFDAQVQKGTVVVDTLSGPKPIEFTTNEAGKMLLATVDMGAPVLYDEASPLALDSKWGTFEFRRVSMGNPHAVCFIRDWQNLPESAFTGEERSLQSFDLDAIGSFFEKHEAFPEKTNVEFVDCTQEGSELPIRVYERGCAETLACGTGSCAVFAAAIMVGERTQSCDVVLPGGRLGIAYNADGHLLMTGPAVCSYSGSYPL